MSDTITVEFTLDEIEALSRTDSVFMPSVDAVAALIVATADTEMTAKPGYANPVTLMGEDAYILGLAFDTITGDPKYGVFAKSAIARLGKAAAAALAAPTDLFDQMIKEPATDDAR